MESDHQFIRSHVLHRLSQKEKCDYLDDNTDCLTDALINLYNSSVWYMQSIYGLVFKSLWQILSFSTEDIHDDHKTLDVISMNNSAGEYSPEESFGQIVHHRLPRSSSHHSRYRSSQKATSKHDMIANKTRVIVRAMSNQNLDRAPSNQTKLSESKCTLGTIDSHIVVVPVPSSQCQQLTSQKETLTRQSDVQQSEYRNNREELADALCRRSHESQMMMTRGMCCEHCRPLFLPNVPFHSSDYRSPSSISRQISTQKAALSQKSEQSSHRENKSETQSYAYSVPPSVQTPQINLLEDEPLSTDTMPYNKMDEENQSILSFPDHDSSISQQSPASTHSHNSRLKSDAQILVGDLIQTAQKKYQKILEMSINRYPQNNTPNTIDQPLEKQLESKEQNTPENNTLCQELCKQLSLSDSNQITEIVRILAFSAPHTLKAQPPSTNSPGENSKIPKGDENTLCSQLLLHPPFKPKRLIHLCTDGSIQVLSAVDENSKSNPIVNSEHYRLDYSNSAVTSSVQPEPILTDDTPLKYERLPIDRMTFIQSSSTEQLSSKKEVYCDRLVVDDDSISSHKEAESSHYHSRTLFRNNEPIVKINLDLKEEMTQISSEDEENSLPEIFFKRIVVPESSTIPLVGIDKQYKTNRKDEASHERRRNHAKSRRHRSRSHRNERVIHTER